MVVVHLLLQWLSVKPLVQWRFLANNKLCCKWNSFCVSIFCPKRRCNSHYIHVLLDGLWKLSMHYWLTFGEYFCPFFVPYWYFEYTKALTLHCVESGRWYTSCKWGNPFWVKLTSSLFQCEPHPQPNLFMPTLSVYAVCHCLWAVLSNNYIYTSKCSSENYY